MSAPGAQPPAGRRAARTTRRLARTALQQAVASVAYPAGMDRYRPPGARRRYRCLAVADVDLDAGTATLRRPITPLAGPAEGVHALVRFHGVPVGDLTVPGDPAVVLRGLPARAARACEGQVLAHLLTDALATPGGLHLALERGLRAVAHPVRTPDTASITVAVCTRDRPEDLRRCLESIGRLRGGVGEVLVVDNASRDDRTRRVAAEFGVRCVREPRAGLDWARNRALLEARTPVVAFADDDVLVEADWARALALAFEDEPGALVVTGLVAPAEFSTPAQVMFEAVGGFGRGYARRWFSVAVDAGEIAARRQPGTGDAGTGANTAVRREEVLALGGFDTALDVGTPTGGGGDLELYFRVLAAGGLVAYEPAAVVLHRHRADVAQLQRQLRGNGTGSYSIFTGAGRNYGDVQTREMTRFSATWFLQHYPRAHVRSLVWPQMYPPRLVGADSRGAVDAVLGRYYRRAQEQAAEQQAQHPLEPQAPPPVHRPAEPRRPRTPDPVVEVDVLRGGPAAAHLPPGAGARRVRVRVLRDGRPQSSFALATGGSGLSRARLAAGLVDHLGPACWPPGPRGRTSPRPGAAPAPSRRRWTRRSGGGPRSCPRPSPSAS
ncbi:glycosyltransferase family 2 protein [Kineococcus rubinsiae]|uniref:glycosyltransferase family 2 protein n=1 Tax=Kineococcus rubinsiae TaxID=2609562 RepID=UPI0014303D8D|nr:glycosyltransferase [Kineococcus rubinsiae]NIZ91116.1 glycosyltransferase [Kineococcus rubinsiae]